MIADNEGGPIVAFVFLGALSLIVGVIEALKEAFIIMFANICLEQNPGRWGCYCSNIFLMAKKSGFVFGLKHSPFRLYFCG